LEYATSKDGLAAGQGVFVDLRGGDGGDDLPGAASFCAELDGSAWAAGDDDA
jgi:hypothetical protein